MLIFHPAIIMTFRCWKVTVLSQCLVFVWGIKSQLWQLVHSLINYRWETGTNHYYYYIIDPSSLLHRP